MKPSFAATNKPKELIKNPRSARNKELALEVQNKIKIPKLNLQIVNDEEAKQPKPAKAPRSSRVGSKSSYNPRFKPREPQTARKFVPQATNPIVKNGPITPTEAKEIYKHMLTSYELKEIDNFPEIYFIGYHSKKIKPKQNPAMNYGYDDEGHFLKIKIGDQIAYRFEIKSVFGKGTFGQVICCYDHKVKKQVALKIIINTQQMHEQGRVEIAILQHLNSRDYEHKSCIVQNIDAFIFRNHVCATFEVLGKNLYEYSRSRGFAPFNQRQIRAVAKKLLIALKFCHANGVVHCDLKPENVSFLPGSTMNCRLIDFGSGYYGSNKKFEYIQSRFYRAPEVVLGIPYGPPMDIWSFACIIVEMMMGKPLFPAANEPDLISMMMEILGIPPLELLYQAKRGGYYFDSQGKPLSNNQVKKKRTPGRISLRTATRISDSDLLDLLSKCFEWDPSKRITASEALQHRWFNTKAENIPKTSRTPRAYPINYFR
jgi:dual specificity tyrosine-phosphorylation-regulated kinase 2/3/4